MGINYLRPAFAAWIARGEIQHTDLRFAVMFPEMAIGLNHDFKRHDFDSGAAFQALVKGRDFNGLVKAAEGRDIPRLLQAGKL